MKRGDPVSAPGRTPGRNNKLKEQRQTWESMQKTDGAAARCASCF